MVWALERSAMLHLIVVLVVALAWHPAGGLAKPWWDGGQYVHDYTRPDPENPSGPNPANDYSNITLAPMQSPAAPVAPVKRRWPWRHDKDRLVLTGPIEFGDYVGVAVEVNMHPDIKTVVLDSPGGLVDDAIEIGRIIRERRLNTTVPASASCVSACVLIWAAGVKRTVDGQLATHCPISGGDPFQCVPSTRQKMVDFLKEMGAPEAVIELQEAAGSTSVLPVPEEFLTPSRPRPRPEAAQPSTTWGARPPKGWPAAPWW